MAMLETNTPKFEKSKSQATDGRFFINWPLHLIAITELARQMRDLGRRTEESKGEVASNRSLSAEARQNAVKAMDAEVLELQRPNLEHLETMLAEMDAAIGLHEGWMMIAQKPEPYPREAERVIHNDYAIDTTEDGLTVLCIPMDAITAHRTNPQYYGIGHETRPVIDLRVRTSIDVAPAVYELSGDAPEPLGKWMQLDLAKVDFCLYPES